MTPASKVAAMARTASTTTSCEADSIRRARARGAPAACVLNSPSTVYSPRYAAVLGDYARGFSVNGESANKVNEKLAQPEPERGDAQKREEPDHVSDCRHKRTRLHRRIDAQAMQP